MKKTVRVIIDVTVDLSEITEEEVRLDFERDRSKDSRHLRGHMIREIAADKAAF
jgi:hypothetical protein